MTIIKHIQKRYTVKKSFPIYTTCGYKIFMDQTDDKKYYAFFVYNTFGIAIDLTSKTSMYHTFDASFCFHQTSVPVCVVGSRVYFNHPSFFILAWGNGKSVKRLWLESRGHAIEGRRVQRTDFERYFDRLSQPDQTTVRQNNWI